MTNEATTIDKRQHSETGSRVITYRQALNETLRAELTRDENVYPHR